MTEEMKALNKKKEMDMLYQREERKLYLSGLRQRIFFFTFSVKNLKI